MPDDTPCHTGKHAVDDHGACDDEHARPDACDKPFTAKLDGGRHHGIGKACDGHKRACARFRGKLLIPAQRGEDAGKDNQGCARERGSVRQGKPRAALKRIENFAQKTDGAADEKRPGAVFEQRRAR